MQPGFPFSPSKIAVFQNGDLLVTGLEYDKDRNNKTMWPFPGIFSSDGPPIRSGSGPGRLHA